MELTGEELDEMRKEALIAVDGLWFLEAERRCGFEAALEADLEVWRRYALIFLRRLLKRAGISPAPGERPGMELVWLFLRTLCRVDGTECSGEIRGGDELIMEVRRCPWWENLKRAGREGLVPCERVDDAIFANAVRSLDPSISMEIKRSFPRGDDRCSFRFLRR